MDDRWDLNRIKDELDRLELDSTTTDDVIQSTGEKRWPCLEPSGGVDDKSTTIYATTGAFGQPETAECQTALAARVITEKYDSLGANGTLRRQLQQQQPQLQFPSSSAGLFVDVEPMTYKHSAASSAVSPSTSADRSASGLPSPVDDPSPAPDSAGRPTDRDFEQVELFYRSYQTEVHVCRCLVDVLHGTGRHPSTNDDASATENGAADAWTRGPTGIAALLLDTGEGRRRRRLHIVVAEPGTAFTLWRDSIDSLTGYAVSAADRRLHVMHSSTDHRRLVGLMFADQMAAGQLLQRVVALTSNADDPLLNLSNSTERRRGSAAKDGGGADRRASFIRRRSKSKSKRSTTMTKADISAPCCFRHVTNLDVFDCPTVAAPLPVRPSTGSSGFDAS